MFAGTPSTTSQMAKDVTTFLSWTSEPELDLRKKMGMQAVIILSTMTAISLYVKRAKWSVIKNRKLCELFFSSFQTCLGFPMDSVAVTELCRFCLFATDCSLQPSQGHQALKGQAVREGKSDGVVLKRRVVYLCVLHDYPNYQLSRTILNKPMTVLPGVSLPKSFQVIFFSYVIQGN